MTVACGTGSARSAQISTIATNQDDGTTAPSSCISTLASRPKPLYPVHQQKRDVSDHVRPPFHGVVPSALPCPARCIPHSTNAAARPEHTAQVDRERPAFT